MFVKAEWHFFPTSYGKGACDGLGGTVKMLAARASLQRVTYPIQTPWVLFEWASKSLANITVKFSTNAEYAVEEKKLEKRYQKTMTVKGTLSFHCFIPKTQKLAISKHYSLQEKSTCVKIIT